jgi:hypothetical protein
VADYFQPVGEVLETPVGCHFSLRAVLLVCLRENIWGLTKHLSFPLPTLPTASFTWHAVHWPKWRGFPEPKSPVVKKKHTLYSTSVKVSKPIRMRLFVKLCFQKFVSCPVLPGAAIPQSVKKLAMSWTVRGSNPDKGEIFPHPS